MKEKEENYEFVLQCLFRLPLRFHVHHPENKAPGAVDGLEMMQKMIANVRMKKTASKSHTPKRERRGPLFYAVDAKLTH